ncbi:hypothetical protein Pure05_30310 [Paenarthrobacter ureafaciens]|nr:hypothetical protein Pure01_29960 [Paenarthrobacter ureafaciens]GLU64789.1 hypothetical protein Pure02_30390 [Paenarthrobacter ureafaciens]GLU69068.1 hypothetical protein Pure03_30440 [Paenarthrobacter ureafaciens]GLU73290.1 hypothetical protein Pure04_30050 [Paenarthrobacter ureafaciens]GLU77591.1 hypothetical protein Pure05_30310 [Paenarthrobacter ureafaciens]
MPRLPILYHFPTPPGPSSITSPPLPGLPLSLPHPFSATLYLGGRYPGSRWDIGEPYTLMGNAVPGSSVRLKPVR